MEKVNGYIGDTMDRKNNYDCEILQMSKRNYSICRLLDN